MAEPPSTPSPGEAPAPPPFRHRGRRIGFHLLLAVLLLPVLLLLASWAGLRSAAVRRAVLARVATAVEQGFGVDLAVGDFSLVGWTGVELRDVRLGRPGAAPLATAERVRASVSLFSLRRETAVVRSLEVFSPVIDLSAPFPELPESEGPPGVEIRKIALHGGQVLGAPVEPPATRWMTRWRIDGIEAAGRFENGPWELTLKRGRARVERPGFPPLPVRLSGHVLQATAGGILRLTDLRADSAGLHLEGSSQIGEGGPIEVIFAGRVEPRLLVAGLPPGGLIEARGNFAPPADGTLSLAAQDVPAEALRPYLDRQLLDDLALAGTAADLRADLAFGPEALERVEGDAELTWKRGAQWLARVEGRVVPGTPQGAGPIRLTVHGDLLPQSPGKRHVQGTVTASGWAGLAEGTAENLVAEVRSPDVAASLAEMRSLWPRLAQTFPALPPDLPVRGALAADLRLDGPLADPRARLQARWTPEADAHVTLRAEGRPSTWTGRAEADLERMPLAMLGTVGRGLVSGRLSLSGSPRAYQTTLSADATAFAWPPYVQALDTLHAEGTGTLDLSSILPAGGGALSRSRGRVGEGASFAGALALDASGLLASPNASDTLRLDQVRIATNGTFRAEPLSWNGDAKVDGAGFDLPGTFHAAEIHLAADEVTASATALAGRLRLDAPRLDLTGAGTTIEALHLEAEGDRREARILALTGALPAGRTFSATGRALLEPLLEEADLELQLTRPVDAVRSADLSASLRSGVVGLSVPRLDTEAGSATLRATVPLGALRQIPQLAETLGKLPLELTPGPVALTLEAPELDSERLLAALGMEARPERLRGSLWTELTFEPAAPAAGLGEIRIEDLRVESPDGRVAAEGPVIATLRDGALEIRPVRLRIDGAGIEGAGVDLRGRADLDRSWNPFEDAPEAVVRNLAFDAGGTLEAALLNPFLQGGVASGALTFSASAAGPLDDLRAEARASGPETSFFWAAPYATRVQRPEMAVSLRDGRWKIEQGKLLLNGGPVEIAGSGATGEPVSIETSFSGVRYRLDYGLTAQLSGRLDLRMPPEGPSAGRSRLAGRVTLDRALLNRDVDLDRELLATFLQPDDTPGTEDSVLSEIDLDLQVATVDGVRIRNNVANLRAAWSPLAVTGTLEVPVIEGRVDIEPGGLLFAYGQTVRVDRGSLLFTGDPLLDPKIDLSTTSSLQDPTIAQLRGGDSPLALLESDDQPDNPFAPRTPELEDTVTAGLTSYYGARVASRLGEAVGLQRISVQPVLVFGETDPSARLTVGGDVSRYVSFALSVDLRNAEDRTYLLDLHGFRELPGLVLQGFTNDAGEEGASLQQVLELGGSRRRDDRPRLRRLRLDFPEGSALRKRLLRRAIRLQRRQPVSASAAFDIETELADTLRRSGWPDPRIRVEVVPAGDRRVDVNIQVEPGPRVEVLFAGDRPPRGTRAAIAALYRPDFYEPVSLEEMKEETVRALRRKGHLEPRVEIAVERPRPDAPDAPDAPRRVTVHSQAGPRSGLDALDLAGIDPESARLAARRFPGPLARAELAVATPGADRRLLDVLRALGYPEARIAGRDLQDDGDRLVVRVEAGERQTLRRIGIEGVEGAERDQLAALLPLRAGDPARLDRISEGALRIERSLESRGFPDATVRPLLKPAAKPDSEQPGVDLLYEVTSGPAVRVTDVGFEGERWSRAAQLERVSGLEPGMPYVNASVEEARARLFDTGVFSRVTADVERGEDGAARVRFSLTERPRFRIGYGARWESGSDKASAVMDFVDTNFLGRALTLGLRGLYEPDDQSGRLYLRTGGLFGTAFSLETYAQVRRLFDDGLIEDSEEGALQLARPFGEAVTGRVYLRYRTTHLYEEEPDPFLPPFDLRIDRPYLGIQAIRDTRNDRIDPVTGLFASLDVSGSGSWIGSDFDYRRLYGQVNLYRNVSLLGRPFVWAQSVRGGWASAGSGQELLREERFFAGGDFSVRGYETESLGPQEILGDLVRPLGGEALFILNQELRFPLPFDLTGLLFFDAGQVWDRAGDVDTDLSKALGLGVRARTPVGLLRLDVGFPLDRRAGEEGYQLYFGFGNAF